MKITFFITFCLLMPLISLAQVPPLKEYKKIKDILEKATTTSQITDSLESFNKAKVLYQRRLHKKYYHLRMYVDEDYQIDALIHKEKVIFRSLTYEDIDEKFHALYHKTDTKAIQRFISKWNTFYQTHKTINELKQEITLAQGFALRAGLLVREPNTDDYKKLKK